LSRLCDVCDNAFKSEEVSFSLVLQWNLRFIQFVLCESFVLSTLDFCLTRATALEFVTMFLEGCNDSSRPSWNSILVSFVSQAFSSNLCFSTGSRLRLKAQSCWSILPQSLQLPV
jgi:hypothetical protein